MKRDTIIKIIVTLMIFIFIYSFGADKNQGEYIVGKIEYTGQGGREGIAVLRDPGKAYLLSRGVLLFIKRGEDRIILKIENIEGKYIRCIVNMGKSSVVINEGDYIYYSDSLNSSIKYGDAKKILGELIKLYESFILKVESTEDTAVIAEAVTDFSAELDKLIPEMKRINSKYPELAKFNINPPAELQNESEMLGVLEPRLKNVFFKIKLFDSDENVRKATDMLHKVLTKMSTTR